MGGVTEWIRLDQWFDSTTRPTKLETNSWQLYWFRCGSFCFLLRLRHRARDRDQRRKGTPKMNGLLLSLAILAQSPPDPGPAPPLAELEVSHGTAVYQTPMGTRYILKHTATIDAKAGKIVITDVQATLVVDPQPVPVPPVPPTPTPPPTPGPAPAPLPVVYCYPGNGAGACGHGGCGHGFRPVRFLLNVAFWPIWLLRNCG
jgi:hypothetical protein